MSLTDFLRRIKLVKGGDDMTEKTNLPQTPWRGWRPGSGKNHDPADPHFNPLHPPRGYPQDKLEKEWGEGEGTDD